MYKVITENRDECFDNLNQIYGYLAGIFVDYRHYHPSFKFFKRWYLARKKRGAGKDEYQFGASSFRIEQG